METKKWYKSKTIRGGIVTLLAFASLIFKLDLDKALITEFVTRALGLIGVVMTIYGRIKAKTKLEK